MFGAPHSQAATGQTGLLVLVSPGEKKQCEANRNGADSKRLRVKRKRPKQWYANIYYATTSLQCILFISESYRVLWFASSLQYDVLAGLTHYYTISYYICCEQQLTIPRQNNVDKGPLIAQAFNKRPVSISLATSKTLSNVADACFTCFTHAEEAHRPQARWW